MKKILSIGVISLSALFTGCTASQQDSLFDNVIEMARSAADLETKTASR